MYKILITTWIYQAGDACEVDTVVVDFPTKSDADIALSEVINNSYSTHQLKQSAIALY